MKKNKLAKYTLGEELMSAITHGFGAVFSIVALVLLILRAVKLKNSFALASALIYGISLIILYLMSTLYHSLSPRVKAKYVFRVLDHCSIYLLILGTYAPVLLYVLANQKALIIFLIMLTIAVVGIVLNAISLDRFKVYGFVSYLVLGWIAVFTFPDFMKILSSAALNYIIAGGIAYTVGALIYLVGKKVKYMHSIWHFFVLAGSVLHFIAIYFYILI